MRWVDAIGNILEASACDGRAGRGATIAMERALNGLTKTIVHPHELRVRPLPHRFVARLAHVGPDYDAVVRLTTRPPLAVVGHKRTQTGKSGRSAHPNPDSRELASGVAPHYAPHHWIWGAALRRNPDEIGTSSHSAWSAQHLH